MNQKALKKFAQEARHRLMRNVEAKLERILQPDSLERRDAPEKVKKIEQQIRNSSREQFVEKIAYTWFNRFCALRYMDIHHYTPIGVVSPAEGELQPEILSEAKKGYIDEALHPYCDPERIMGYLSGSIPSHDPQVAAYRLLILAVCNHLNDTMPFLFEKMADYTELLMPDDLLSGNSILAYTRAAMTPDACEDVEVIGWLYQFYISEKKDEVFYGLKKKKKITPENIPAATQLFTPHWIVRYLVENSLGRLWMLNRPDSKLIEKMDYYIKPEQPETDFLRINKPEEIKVCDPACGSGHMLTYAFDLLYAIYEEEGYEPTEIPEKILTNNLYGIEIDERAGELAAFALTMKARRRSRRFFRKVVKPNICVLENVKFEEGELAAVGNEKWVVGSEKRQTLHHDLNLFEEANNFGSLLRPQLPLEDIESLQKTIHSTPSTSHSFFEQAPLNKVKVALEQASYLSPKYHVVIANPPYMGSKGMNGRLASWAKGNYPNSKSDFFAMFIDRNLDLSMKHGFIGMVTMQTWMFLSSFRALRDLLVSKRTILNMAHLGPAGFDGLSKFIVQTTAFILSNTHIKNYVGTYYRLVDFDTSEDKRRALASKREQLKFNRNQEKFSLIPGTPISYWLPKEAALLFEEGKSDRLGDIAEPRQGLLTSDNDRFLRLWHEAPNDNIGYGFDDRQQASESGFKWFPINKGGVVRKWYGNLEFIINWQNDGLEIHNTVIKKYPYLNGNSGLVLKSTNPYFREAVTWTDISNANFGVRYLPKGCLFEKSGSCIFPTNRDLYLGLLCSKVSTYFFSSINPSLHFQVGDVANFPVIKGIEKQLQSGAYQLAVSKLIDISKEDWNSFESSWDFTSLSLLSPDYRQQTLKATYQKLRAHWYEMTLEMQRLEEENNRIFIDAYGLQDELTPEVPLGEITLTCNPHYRYGNDKSEDELEALLLADTMRELVSYAVGCMFGRYALDKPGLILANQGEIIGDYLKRVPEPSFPADDDNVIPMLDGDWFTDDIAERFKQFLKVAFGSEHYEENLRFVEQALNIKGKRNYGIRNYFLKDFYTDHVKRYKKRPIYWLFSSPKGSFNALIYMHRYRPDTVSVVLNDYLREFRTKLESKRKELERLTISELTSGSDKTKALKEIESIKKQLKDIEEYEREILHPLASERIEIDLDDGVKTNYPKFGNALKPIKGLS